MHEQNNQISRNMDHQPSSDYSVKIAQKLGYTVTKAANSQVQILSVSKNQDGHLLFEITENRQIKVVDKSYLIARSYLEILCEFYESKIQIIDHFDENQKKKDTQNQVELSSKQESVKQKQQPTKQSNFILQILSSFTAQDLEKYGPELPNFYRSFVNEKIKKEDQFLLSERNRLEKKKKSYAEIAIILGRQNGQYWSKRYYYLDEKGYGFSPCQKSLLQQLVKRYGLNWGQIQKQFNKHQNASQKYTKSGLQWHYNKMIERGDDWTIKQDLLFIRYLIEYNGNLTQVSKQMKINIYELARRYNLLVVVAGKKKKNRQNGQSTKSQSEKKIMNQQAAIDRNQGQK